MSGRRRVCGFPQQGLDRIYKIHKIEQKEGMVERHGIYIRSLIQDPVATTAPRGPLTVFKF
jgi:hypothetical protein